MSRNRLNDALPGPTVDSGFRLRTVSGAVEIDDRWVVLRPVTEAADRIPTCRSDSMTSTSSSCYFKWPDLFRRKPFLLHCNPPFSCLALPVAKLPF
jgi:hypothetical protein